MARSTYAGNWDTRRVKLAEDEKVLRASRAVRWEALGILYSMGVLTLTTHRLIWTPFPYIGDISPWTVTKRDMRSVSVVDQKDIDAFSYAFNRWALRVERAHETRRFGIGGWRVGHQRSKADQWLEAIQEWIN